MVANLKGNTDSCQIFWIDEHLWESNRFFFGDYRKLVNVYIYVHVHICSYIYNSISIYIYVYYIKIHTHRHRYVFDEIKEVCCSICFGENIHKCRWCPLLLKRKNKWLVDFNKTGLLVHEAYELSYNPSRIMSNAAGQWHSIISWNLTSQLWKSHFKWPFRLQAGYIHIIIIKTWWPSRLG